jgi:regulator of protease activity HflC (stomatin/prohibitin superfamily)
LVLFGGVTLYLSSCIVVVRPDEQAIIEHFGNPLNKANEVRLLGPGLSLKWPWPIDIAYKHRTKGVSEINIGYVLKRDPKTGEVLREPSLLWGQEHYEEEYHLLVADEQAGAESLSGTAPVSLLIAAVPVQYRIRNLYHFLYNYRVREERQGTKVHTVYESKEVLESICSRELTKFAASAKIGVDDDSDMQQGLLGTARAETGDTLTARIQEAAKEAGLGVEIVFVGLQGIHPPSEVAADYQKVIGAVQEKQALILQAQAERNAILSTLVGSVGKANELYDLAVKYREAEDANSPEDMEEVGKKLDMAFREAKGIIFETQEEAKSYRFKKATLAEATGQRFAGQLKAYRAAPETFIREQRLAMLERALANIRKYVIVADPNDSQVIVIDFQDKLDPSIYEMGGFVESSEK